MILNRHFNESSIIYFFFYKSTNRTTKRYYYYKNILSKRKTKPRKVDKMIIICFIKLP